MHHKPNTSSISKERVAVDLENTHDSTAKFKNWWGELFKLGT